MIDENRIAEIEGRLAAATPGPWTGSLCGEEVYAHGDVEAVVADLCGTIGNDKQHEYNTEFIANAPTDIAALIKALKDARAKLARAEKAFFDLYGNNFDSSEGWRELADEIEARQAKEAKS